MDTASPVRMDPPFVFLPLANYCAYPQYTCCWHPFMEPDSPGDDTSGDTDQRSSSSDAPGDSGASSSGALSEWTPPPCPQLATPQRPPPHLRVVVQSPQPPRWACTEHPSPRKRLAARRLQGGDAKRASWQGHGRGHEPFSSTGDSREAAGGSGRNREAQQRAQWQSSPSSSILSPGEAPRWSVRARGVPPSPGSTAPKPPITPRRSPASCPVLSRRAAQSGRSPRWSAWTPAAHPEDFDAFSMGPLASPRGRRYRLPSASCRGSPSMSSTESFSEHSSGGCGLCREALDLNRALYRSHCGELCHLQCARAERRRQHGPCPLCGQPADQQSTSPCF